MDAPDDGCGLAVPDDLMAIWLACDDGDGDTDTLVAEFGAAYGPGSTGEVG